MKTKKTITRINPDDLSQVVWTFRTIELKVVLDRYEVQTRATKRHKFIRARDHYYDRHNGRDSSLSMDDVPLPLDVAEEARQQVMAQICIAKTV